MSYTNGKFPDTLQEAGLTPQKKSYTDRELVELLWKWREEHEHPPTTTEINEDDMFPHASTFRKRFGSWSAALEKVGLTPKGPQNRYTDEELITSLQRYTTENDEVSPTIMGVDGDDSMPSISTFKRRFGSWSAALEEAGLTTTSLRYTDRELIEYLQEWNEEHGYPPTVDDTNNSDNLPTYITYTKRFGSWSAALEEAGLTSRPSTKSYSDEELLAYLRRWPEEHGEPPIQQDIREKSGAPNPTTYKNHFGTWNNALEEAGLTPRYRTTHYYEDEELLKILREWDEKHGQPPTTADIQSDDSLPSMSPFRERFGSLTEAIEAAGLTPQNSPNPGYTDDELLNILREFIDEYGRPPTIAEMNNSDTYPHKNTFIEHFGTWEQTLDAVGV